MAGSIAVWFAVDAVEIVRKDRVSIWRYVEAYDGAECLPLVSIDSVFSMDTIDRKGSLDFLTLCSRSAHGLASTVSFE